MRPQRVSFNRRLDCLAIGWALFLLLVVLSNTSFGQISSDAAQRDPNASDALAYHTSYDQGVAFFEAGEYDKAIAAFQRALHLNSRDADTWYNLGVSYGRVARGQEAVVAYRRALALSPAHAKAQLNLCATLISVGRNWEALDECKRSIRLTPHAGLPYFSFGAAHLALGHNEDAVEAFRLAIARQPDLIEAHYNLGLIQYTLKQYVDAIVELQRAIRLSQKRRDGLQSETSEAATRALQAVTDDLRRMANEVKSGRATDVPFVRLGDAFRMLGWYAPAADAYRHALRLTPKDAQLYVRLGLAHYGANEFREAENDYKHALKLDPTLLAARQNLERLLRATKPKAKS